MVESAGFENRYLGQPGSRVRIPPSPPHFVDCWIADVDDCRTSDAERCRSGLTGTPGKRVWATPTAGSNPVLSAIAYLETVRELD